MDETEASPVMFGERVVPREVSPAEQASVAEYEQMFSAGTKAEKASEYDQTIAFENLANRIGLTQRQAQAIRDQDKRWTGRESMQESDRTITKLLRGVGCSDKQIAALLKHDHKLNGWR